tara:strand:+ start:157 stop:306 length:150 start_codon:yes stop_codon:yes gene_type:complete
VKFLTAQEQRVLLVIMFLLLVGWAVKAWREAQPAATAKPLNTEPAKAID